MMPAKKKALFSLPLRVAGLCRRYVARYFDRGARLHHLYDKCTVRIMSKVLDRESHCADVGCHTGQVLKHMPAKLHVRRGTVPTITSNKPYIVFEHGLGAADYYGTRPETVYDLLVGECGLNVSMLPEWLKRRPPLSRDGFVAQFDGHLNFNFLVSP